MQFSWLEGACNRWDKVLVIGRTFERDGKKYHMIGMTLAEEACLYLIEPYTEAVQGKRRKNANQRFIKASAASFLLMRCKPEKKAGIHGLPLKSCAISHLFSPDTEVVSAELFSYIEKTVSWEENI